MNNKYEIEYLPLAVSDLTDIFEYLKLDSPQATLKLLDHIDKSILQLEDFPYIGVAPKEQRLVNLGYRMLIVENYLVFYVVLDNKVEIRRVIYGKRKYSFLL